MLDVGICVSLFAVAMLLRDVLVGIVICAGLRAIDPEQREFALAVLRILKPPGRRRRFPRRGPS